MAVSTAAGATTESFAEKIAKLIDPAKLATLGKREANPRVQKVVYWLETARQEEKYIPAKLAAEAVRLSGMTNTAAATLTVNTMVRNYSIASQLGCFDAEGMAEMRRGNSPTVRNGPYKGQELSVDHIIPRAVVPELDCVIANLELMPLKMNMSKNDKIGERQLAVAQQFYAAGLLTVEGLKKVKAAGK